MASDGVADWELRDRVTIKDGLYGDMVGFGPKIGQHHEYKDRRTSSTFQADLPQLLQKHLVALTCSCIVIKVIDLYPSSFSNFWSLFVY